MSKLKKSVKAIIISICAVVVIAGSCLGAVLLSKKPTNPNSGDKDNSAINEVCSLTPEQIIFAQKLNKANESSNKIATIFNNSDYLYEDGSVIDKSLIYKTYENYFESESGKNETIYWKVINGSFVYYKDIYSFIETQNIILKKVDYVQDNFVALRYVYQVGEKYNLALTLLDVSNISNVQVVYETEINNLEYHNYEDNDSKIYLSKNYYLVAIDNGTQVYNIAFYNYASNQKLKDYDVDVSKLNEFYVDKSSYIFNQGDNFYFGLFDNEFSAYEKNIENANNFYICNELVFIEIAEFIESAAEKNELTVNNVNYSYRVLNLRTNELSNFKLKNGYSKAYFNMSVDGYIEIFEEKYVDNNFESGEFTYYDFEFNKILVYEADSISQNVIYFSNKNFLTKKGILTVNKSISATYKFEFKSNNFNYELASDYVSNETFLVGVDNRCFKIMNMNGELVFDQEFVGTPYVYDDGYYVFDSSPNRYLINVNSKTVTKIENFADVNHYFVSGAGYYFVKNADLSYSFYDYKGNLIYDNINKFDFSKSSGKTYLKITDNDNNEIYYIYNSLISFDETQYKSTNLYSTSKLDSVETYADKTQTGSGTGYSYTYTFGLGSDKSQYTFEISCSQGYYLYSAEFYPGRNATYKDGHVKTSETSVGTYDYHDSQPTISCELISVAGPTLPGQTLPTYYVYTISGDLKDGNDSEELAGTTTIVCYKISMAVTYANKGTFSPSFYSANYGDEKNINYSSTPTQVGYTFSSWTHSSQYVSGTSPTFSFYPYIKGQSVEFTANWTVHTYKISYDYGNGTAGTYNPSTATYDVQFTVSNPTRIGYTFKGWTLYGMSGDCTHYWDDTDQGSSSDTVWYVTATTFKNLHCNQDATVYFYAKWDNNDYSISYTLNGGNEGSNAPTSTWYGGTAYISNPTRVGYTFAGWSISNMSTDCTHYFDETAQGSNSTATGVKATSFKNLRSTDGTVRFSATWTANGYTIAYELNGGEVGDDYDPFPTTATYNSGNIFIPNYALSKTGYSFVSWSVTGMTDDCTHYYGLTEPNTSVTGTSTTFGVGAIYFKNLRSTAGIVTFTANWTPNTYTIAYEYSGGSLTSGSLPTTATYDTAVNIPNSNVAKTGYIFANWTVTGMTDDCTHYYGLTEPNFSITGTSATFNAGAIYFKNLRSTSGTVTFTAVWTPITYNLTYDANGGVFNSGTNNPPTATYDVSFPVTSPVRHGYNFTGWKIEGGTRNGATESASANYPSTVVKNFSNLTATSGATIKLVAQWTAVTYNIKIVYNSHLSTSTVTATFNSWKYISKPDKTGYTFAYWDISGMTACGHTSNCACFSSADNGTCSHYYNSSASDTGATRFTGTSLAKTTATYFKNLACTQGTTVTITAHWTKKTYKVINAGATYGATISTEYPKFDEVFSMTATTSAPLGYHFNGWKITGANSTDENTGLTVTHYYGTTSSATTTFTGTEKTVASNVMYFKNLSSNAYVSESSTSAIVTITPVWAANTYTITFNMNNPDRYSSNITSKSNISANYDSAVYISNPTKTGYSFLGWSLSTLSDDCTHYYGTSSSSMTAFESANNAYKDPDNPNKYVLLKQTYYKNLRSDTGTATLTANWAENAYTITYHYIPASFNAGAYNASQLFTHINIAGNMTGTITYDIVYNDTYTAIDYKNARGEENFGLPVGLHFKLWSISSSTLSSSTSVAKYDFNNVVITALSDSIQPNESRIYGPGKSTDGNITWKYYGSNIHLYACYDLAGINIRYYAPSTVAGENNLGSYSNISALNKNVKYTELFTFASSASVVDGINLMGWMISADYFSSGDLTEQSVTVYEYNGNNYVAYQGVQGYWAYTNVDAYSYEDPTYFLYAVYGEEYSGSFDVLSFTYNTSTNSKIFSSKYYSVGRSSQAALPTTVKIPKYYNDGTHGFLPVETITTSGFERNSADNDQINTIIWFDSMKTIGTSAFKNQWYLKNYTLNEGLVNIYSAAFYNCDSITEVIAPSTLKSISQYAFYSCDALATISLNEGLETIDNRAFTYAEKVNGVLSLPSTVCGTLGAYAFYLCSGITSVQIPSGVTEIGNDCFDDCTKLASVTFASNSSLNRIDEYAFWGCSELTSINIPNSVTYIGNRAFYANTKLASIIMPSSLTYLGEYSFYNCVNLASITLPRGLTTIKNSTFSGCTKLASIKLYDGITKIEDWAFNECSSLTSITIPNSVTEFGGWVFYGCSSLRYMRIPFIGYSRTATGDYEGVFGYQFGAESYEYNYDFVPGGLETVILTDPTQLDDYAFYGCSGIVTIEIAKSLQSVGSHIFEGCSNITNLTIPFLGTSRTDTTNDYLAYYWGTTYTDGEAYLNNDINIILTDANHVGNYAFTNLSLYISLNEGITSIGNYAFQYSVVGNIKDGVKQNYLISFPTTLKTIGNYAFVRANIAAVYFNEGLETIGDYAFEYSTDLVNIVFPTTLKTIGSYAFAYCWTIETAKLNNGLTTIGRGTFLECTSLEEIKIPSTVTVISVECFADCDSLVSVTLHDNITAISSNAFSYSALASITLPKNLITIQDYAFHNTNLTEVVIPSKVTSIGDYAFNSCSSLNSLKFENLSATISIGDFAFEYTQIEWLELPSGVRLGDASFRSCTNLKTIIFYGRITQTWSIGLYAPFFLASNLEAVYLSEPQDVAYAGVFSNGGRGFGVTSTSTFFYGAGISYNYDHMVFTYHEETDSYSFRAKGDITGDNGRTYSKYNISTSYYDTIDVPSTYNDGIHGWKTVTMIEPYAFTNADVSCGIATGKYDLKLPEQVQYIGDHAFENTGLYYTHNFPSTITYLGSYAFAGCYNFISTITIPSTLTKISDYAFYNCDLLCVELEPATNTSLTYIGNYAFYSIYAYNDGYGGSITFPSTLKYIGDYAFYDIDIAYETSAYQNMTLPDSLLYLGKFAFYNNDWIRSVVISSSLECINEGTFASCHNIHSVYIPKSVTTISVSLSVYCYPFYYCGEYNNETCTFYLENDRIPSGWDSRWNYCPYVTQYVFFNMPCIPDVSIKNKSSDYKMTQDLDNDIIKYSQTYKYGSNVGLTFEASYFVAIRFDIMVRTTDVNFDACVSIERSNGYTYYPCSLKGALTTDYQHVNVFLGAGDKMQIIFTDASCTSSYSYDLYVKNLRIDPIKLYNEDYTYINDHNTSGEIETSGGRYDFSFYNKSSDGVTDLMYSTNYNVHNSVSGFTYYATDACEISLSYRSYAENYYDYLIGFKNGTVVFSTYGKSSLSYTRYCAKLSKGDKFSLVYRKDSSSNVNYDRAYIWNFSITKISQYDATTDKIDYASVIGSISSGSYAFKNATVQETMDTIGPYTTIALTTVACSEVLTKKIVVTKHNATMTFVMWNYGLYNGLNATNEDYYMAGPMMIVSDYAYNSSDNVYAFKSIVSIGTFLLHRKCTAVTLTIPNPGTYYLHLNLGGFADGQSIGFDFYCAEAIGVMPVLNGYNGCFDRWDSGYADASRTDMVSYTRIYYNTNVDHWNNNYYPYLKTGDLYFKSANTGIGNSSSSTTYVAPSDGLLTFDYTVSSEEHFDIFVVRLNGEIMLTRSGSFFGSYAFALKQGDKVEFEYMKDGSQNVGNDQVVVKNIHFQPCFVFNSSYYMGTGTSYDWYASSTNQGASDSECVFVVHPRLTNSINYYGSSDVTSFATYAYEGETPYWNTFTTVRFYVCRFENVYDKIEIYGSSSGLVFSSKDYNTENSELDGGTYSMYTYMYGTYCWNEYYIIKFIKDSTIDRGADTASFECDIDYDAG